MGVWRERMRFHSNASYVHVIVNEGRDAGASLPHTHAQLYALPFVPAQIARERERFTAYALQAQGRNLLDDLLQEEVRLRERVVAIDDEAVAICPFASRVPFELQIVPRRPSGALRGGRPARRRHAARPAGPAGAAARRRAGPEPVGADGAAGRRVLLLADRPAAAPGEARRPRDGRRREPQRDAAREAAEQLREA